MTGLDSKPKRISPKYFYDRAGSDLFEQICIQPEYYPTRTEAAILHAHSSDIAKIVGAESNVVVELGSGSSSKTRILLRSFACKQMTQLYYFPIDISPAVLHHSTSALAVEFPRLKVTGLVAEYVDGIARAKELISNENNHARCIITFLGSSIGNFEPKEAVSFTAVIAKKMKEGDFMLVGFDLQKDERILNAAYNDAAGVTAKFNLNILSRINSELGGEFNLNLFKHYAFYNRHKNRIEMHLISAAPQEAYISEVGKSFDFAKGESIHTENSYKYTRSQIDSLAKSSGLRIKRHFLDRKRWFDLALFERI